MLVAALIFSSGVLAQDERIYLTGKGLDDAVKWDFYCTGGMQSGSWSQIRVPSQWETEGFGEYSYGRWYKEGRPAPPNEEGIYRRRFTVPRAWRGQQVRVVFEGVMTDAEVKINGRLVGKRHQGAFYEFAYDISKAVRYGQENEIEVHVWKESSDKSVNAAERKADWWIFGGIFRPIYLTCRPTTHIESVALNPEASGRLTGTLQTTPLKAGMMLEMTLDGERVLRYTLGAGTTHTIDAEWLDVKTWHPEHPNLYTLTLNLLDAKGNLVHTHDERIGFRTVEVREGDGLYLNGEKLRLKGINRHSFHPEGGRTTSEAISRMDGELIKAMNINAVRVHYAPDRHFLDVCDSLGLVVLDELCGWQNCYSEEVGTPLVKAFLERDRNRACVIIWSNGNEGGWNTALDKYFSELDPQKRPLVHPWADFGPIDTHHYPAYQTGIARFTNGQKLFMPTEFMHGMYDQGHGAGLEDFWNKYTSSPLFVGGFMWDFSDNAVLRTDRNGMLDSDGSNGCDGILGPYREKEASFYSVRDIWAPVQFENLRITSSFDGRILVRNDFLVTNLEACSAEYRLYKYRNNQMEKMGEGKLQLPALDPRCSGYAKMAMPQNFFDADVVEFVLFNPDQSQMVERTYAIHRAARYVPELNNATEVAKLSETAEKVTLSAAGVEVEFDKTTARISRVIGSKGNLSLVDGPLPVGMNARLERIETRTEGQNAVMTAYYLGAIDSIRWTMRPDGRLKMEAVMLNRANGGKGFDDAVVQTNITNFGLSFRYPEQLVESVRWFGRGVDRVWKNRVRGTQWGVWSKDRSVKRYPFFEGYHADVRDVTFTTKEGDIRIYTPSDGLFVRWFSTPQPSDNKSGIVAYPDFPEGDLSFLYEIPAIRSFKPISDHGPQSQPGHIRIKKGDDGIHMSLLFEF